MLGNYLLFSFFLFSLPQERKVTFLKSVILSSWQPQLRADWLCTFHAILLAVPRDSFISCYLKIIPVSYLSLEKLVAEAKCLVDAFLKRTSLSHSFGKYLWSRIEKNYFSVWLSSCGKSQMSTDLYSNINPFPHLLCEWNKSFNFSMP